jgi:hypothetical protein
MIMVKYELYSRRKKAAERAGQPVELRYDALPNFLRKQIAMTWDSGIGCYYPGYKFVDDPPPCANEYWRLMYDMMNNLSEPFHQYIVADNPYQTCTAFLLTHADVDECLDIIEISCRILAGIADVRGEREDRGATVSALNALERINDCFTREGVGYQFSKGSIVRIDSALIHAEVVQPALGLLVGDIFKEANSDFMDALRHYRHGDFKDTVTAANRAFESTLKAICHVRSWEYRPGDRASELIIAVHKNGLFAGQPVLGVETYVSMMKMGLPGVANNFGRHGRDPEANPVPDFIAAYALHLMAANILMLMNAHKAKT